MNAFNVLSDPVRRRIPELLADGERTAGEVGTVVQAPIGTSQRGASQPLPVRRDNGFATVRAEGTRRLYAVDPTPLREIDLWLERYRRFWTPHLDALATELARGKRARRLEGDTNTPVGPPSGTNGATKGREDR